MFKDENPPSEQPGGKDDVTYTIPDYKDTGKTDTVSGNVNRLYSSQNGATYEVTGAGPYTVNYTITVPAQDMDLTRVQLTDTYSTNQTLNTGSFVLTVDGQTVNIPQGALNSSTPGQFTLDVLQAMGISSLEKGKEIKLTYSATTNTVGEDITNRSVWSFNSVAGEDTDEKETKEKLDKPEYKPGSKYVRNENANKELTDLTENDRYRFDWTLTITEPGELTRAILKDDYGTSDKPHTMMIDSEHPMTITAGSSSITFDSLSAFTSSNAVTYDSASGRFSIDMIRLFNVQKFPAGTTFRAEYSTETTGDTVPDPGTYHNAATWDFDGIGGPENDIPGGEALAAKEESGSYVIDQLPYGTYEVTESNTTVGTYLLTTAWVIDDQNKSSGQVTIGDENVDGAVVEITNEYEVSTTDFTFYKIWHDRMGVAADWDTDIQSITVTVSRTPSGLADTFNYTYDVPIEAFTAEGTEISANGADADAPKLKVKSGTGNEKYTFFMENIPKVNAAREPYIYSVTETAVDGYKDPSYGFKQESDVVIRIGGTSAEDDQYIINTPQDAVSLPKTGGPGTKLIYSMGIVFTATAGFFLFIRRRRGF